MPPLRVRFGVLAGVFFASVASFLGVLVSTTSSVFVSATGFTGESSPLPSFFFFFFFWDLVSSVFSSAGLLVV